VVPESTCRSCGSPELESILSLGRMPLANALLRAEELNRPEPVYPLDLVFCPHCALVQIAESVSPETMFGDYLYYSSFSDTMLHSARELAEELIDSRGLGPGSSVVELGSNDGYLLQYYKRAGVPVLGVEPAANIALTAQEERGIPTICEFFGVDLAKELRGRGLRADVIHAHNVLAHVPDLNGFVEGIGILLKDDGVAVIEVPYVVDMIDKGEFDTIYHEHHCYFSLTALRVLFERHGLTITDVRRIPIHGGSLRLYVSPTSGAAEMAEDGRVVGAPAGSPRAGELATLESRRGVDRFSFYRGFAGRVRDLGQSLTKLLRDLKRDGNRLAGYGAAAKATVLLNYLGIGPGILDFVADRSPYKQGLYIPGVRIPIRPPAALLEEMPDCVLVLAWNFADEIISQQAEYRARGGRFIVPLPEMRVIEA